ncbi:hypothetical protein R1flu_017062 [Riccia fluitans]|uniref:Uncharacterized protein n=1 Tax=Riccia fluitans TaxID=41844 RepID=A0ABD1YP52_9MARC
MNVHNGINRYSAEEKENARKKLWRMQVKFQGELCEPIDPDSRKRRRTLGRQTSNKRSRKSENTESGERAEHIEAATSGPDQVPVDQEPTHMPFGDAPADPSPVVVWRLPYRKLGPFFFFRYLGMFCEVFCGF